MNSYNVEIQKQECGWVWKSGDLDSTRCFDTWKQANSDFNKFLLFGQMQTIVSDAKDILAKEVIDNVIYLDDYR